MPRPARCPGQEVPPAKSCSPGTDAEILTEPGAFLGHGPASPKTFAALRCQLPLCALEKPSQEGAAPQHKHDPTLGSTQMIFVSIKTGLDFYLVEGEREGCKLSHATIMGNMFS